jgi:hypothetical protein
MGAMDRSKESRDDPEPVQSVELMLWIAGVRLGQGIGSNLVVVNLMENTHDA